MLIEFYFQQIKNTKLSLLPEFLPTKAKNVTQNRCFNVPRMFYSTSTKESGFSNGGTDSGYCGLSGTGLKIGHFYGEGTVHRELSGSMLGKTAISGFKQQFQIINPEISYIELYKALLFLKDLVSKKKQPKILFLNTTPELSRMVETTAIVSGHYYINSKWVGGTLTNWSHVSKSIKALANFERKWRQEKETNGQNFSLAKLRKWRNWFAGFQKQLMVHSDPNQGLKDRFKIARVQKTAFQGAQKMTQVYLDRDTKCHGLLADRQFLNLEKMTNISNQFVGVEPSNQTSHRVARKQRSVQSSSTYHRNNGSKTNSYQMILEKPDVLIVLDPYKQQYAIKEAEIAQIPVIGFVETDIKTKGMTFAIPSNNQNQEFLHFCLNWIIRIAS